HIRGRTRFDNLHSDLGYSLAAEMSAESRPSAATTDDADRRRCRRDAGLRAAAASGWLPFADLITFQLASLAMCVICRHAQKPVLVNVAKRTPKTLWSIDRPRIAHERIDSADEGDGTRGAPGFASRVPRPTIEAISWIRASPCSALRDKLPSEAKRLMFGSNFNHTVVGIRWPEGLEEIRFGSKFSQPVAGVAWPASLKRLSFGSAFDQSLADATFPEGLEEISFGSKFNQSLLPVQDSTNKVKEGGVRLPSTLERIALGSYRRSLTGVSWPPGLLALVLTGEFDLPLAGITLPDSLEELEISSTFNHPIDEVDFPRGLKTLTFGNHFNQ
ncbi:unnamed protein product, partial [Ectocarpus sp. 12 AP-2014]